MKLTTRIISWLAAAALAVAAAGCSDENFDPDTFEPVITTQGDCRVSSFAMSKRLLQVPSSVAELTFHLKPCAGGPGEDFSATVEHHGNAMRCDMRIERDRKIADGDYTLYAILAEGDTIERSVDVTFRSELLKGVLTSTYEFHLKGSGTSSDPYIIGSRDDFDTFEYGLSRDSTAHARGLFFRQTADFDAPRRSDVVDGRYYAGCDFAGSYDGSGHTIDVSYIGSRDQVDISAGLFNYLHTGASVSNLTVRASMQGLGDNSGVLAGCAEDSVTLSRVTVEGAVTKSGSNLGGFIGYATGRLFADGCRLFLQLEGDCYVGGLVGLMDNGSLKVSDFSNLHDDYTPGLFTINASRYAGGLVGGIGASDFEIRDVTLHHTISEQEKDIRVIHADKGVLGGLMGWAGVVRPSSLTSVKVLAPVYSSGSDVGGLFGRSDVYADLTVQNCSVGSLVRGTDRVGGFFGNITSRGHIIFAGLNRSNRVAQVDNGYIAVEGSSEVGGVFGYLSGDIRCSSITLVNVNVTASNRYAGGIIGHQHTSTLDAQYFETDRDMHVAAQEGAGGLVGWADGSTVRGRMKEAIDFSKVPRAADFVSDFSGTVASTTSGGGNGVSMGGIVGYAHDSYLERLCADGSVFGRENVGGIVGSLFNTGRGSLTDCVSKCQALKNTQGYHTGGIAGHLTADRGPFCRLVNFSGVEGASRSGGIIGTIDFSRPSGDFTLEYAVNLGTVSGSDYAGGCVALIDHDKSIAHTISNCANYGSVSNSASGSLGGILGHGDASRLAVMHCANHGAVSSGSGSSNVGGIAGRLGRDPGGVTVGENMEMAYCCNRGTVSAGNGDSYVGGLLGYQEEGNDYDDQHWMTHDCYNMGAVTSDQKHDNGGIVGCVDHYSEVVRCINVGKVSHGNGVVGTHKGSSIWHHHNLYYLEGSGKGWCADSFKESSAKSESTFHDFDFSNVWRIDTDGSVNGGYPYLRDCRFQSLKP